MSEVAIDAPSRPRSADRLPPQDLETEMACLGAMLINRDVVGEVLQVINRSDSVWFYDPRHRDLYEVIVDQYDKNLPIDLRVISDELKRRGLLDKVGGPDYMVQLAESFGDWANAEHYARIVRDKGILRDLIGAVRQIEESAYSQTEQANDVLDDAERRLFAVTEQRISNRARLVGESLKELAGRIELKEGGILTGLATGFHKLDEMTSGFQAGDFIVIAARPSMGKTALGLTIAEDVAVRQKKPVVFFSMEMSHEQVAQRLLCSYARYDSHKLRRRLIAENELPGLLQACDDLAHAPFYVDDTPGMTILELRAKARRLAMQHEIQAVFVDYLQLMRAPKEESRQTEVAAISRGLKALGRELNIPIIVMAQLNRMSEERKDHRPRMSDLRESGAIEQDADVILLIHREEYYKTEDDSLRGLAELLLAKQRNGPTGTVQLQFNHKYTRFDNRAIVSDNEPPPRYNEPAPF